MDRERGAGYYNFYLIFFLFVSTRRKRERLLLLLLGCCCCSSFSISISGRRMERRHLFPPCDSYLIGRWNSLGICLRHFSPSTEEQERDNQLSFVCSTTDKEESFRRNQKNLLSFFLSFFSLFRKSQISCSSPPALFSFVCYSSVIRLSALSISIAVRERGDGGSLSVCVCVPTQSFFFLKIKKKKEFKIIFFFSFHPKNKRKKIKGGIVINMPSRYEPSDRL